MYFIEKGKPPASLSQLQEEYSKPVKGKRLNNKWTEPEIREPLIAVFENNCGYCGIGTGTKKNKITGKKKPQGEVDHYLPVSQFPDSIYKWSNLIWSCRGCNREKSNYYDRSAMIFNPCVKEDPDFMVLYPDGRYHLKKEYSEKLSLQKRFDATHKHTNLNLDVNRKNRSAIIERIKIALADIRGYIQSNSKLKTQGNKDYFILLVKNFQSAIQALKRELASPNYKKMTRNLIAQYTEGEVELQEILKKEDISW